MAEELSDLVSVETTEDYGGIIVPATQADLNKVFRTYARLGVDDKLTEEESRQVGNLTPKPDFNGLFDSMELSYYKDKPQGRIEELFSNDIALLTNVRNGNLFVRIGEDDTLLKKTAMELGTRMTVDEAYLNLGFSINPYGEFAIDFNAVFPVSPGYYRHFDNDKFYGSLEESFHKSLELEAVSVAFGAHDNHIGTDISLIVPSSLEEEGQQILSVSDGMIMGKAASDSKTARLIFKFTHDNEERRESILHDLERTMRKLKGITFIKKEIFDRLYEAEEKQEYQGLKRIRK